MTRSRWGCFSVWLVWPGTSRAAATILGGMLIGIERKTAAEYSFLAAVPALCAAVGYDLFKSRSILHASDIPTFAVGFVVAFLAASGRRQRLHPPPRFAYVKRRLAGIALSSRWAFFSCSAQDKSKALCTHSLQKGRRMRPFEFMEPTTLDRGTRSPAERGTAGTSHGWRE